MEHFGVRSESNGNSLLGNITWKQVGKMITLLTWKQVLFENKYYLGTIIIWKPHY